MSSGEKFTRIGVQTYTGQEAKEIARKFGVELGSTTNFTDDKTFLRCKDCTFDWREHKRAVCPVGRA